MKNEKIENENEMVHSHLLKRKCYRQDENHLIFKGINWICSVVIARDMQKEKKIYIFIFYARTSYLYIFYIHIPFFGDVALPIQTHSKAKRK